MITRTDPMIQGPVLPAVRLSGRDLLQDHRRQEEVVHPAHSPLSLGHRPKRQRGKLRRLRFRIGFWFQRHLNPHTHSWRQRRRRRLKPPTLSNLKRLAAQRVLPVFNYFFAKYKKYVLWALFLK